MISSVICWVYTMIGSEKERIVWPHQTLYLGNPAINFSQRLTIASTIAAMAPEHIKFYQIHEKKAFKVSLKPAQCSSHALAISFRVIPLCESTTGKKIFNFANADRFFAR